MLSLDEIIKGCKRYDRKSQKLLYDRFAPLVKSICIRYIGYSEDWQDVVQDGFIKVYMNIGSFEGKGSFEGWVRKVFVTTAIKHLQKNKKRLLELNKISELEFNDSNINQIDDASNNIDPQDSKDIGQLQAINLADLREDEILAVIQLIPEPFRTVFNMFCIEEFSHDEIANLLKIDASTSRTRLLRARVFLKKELYELSISKLTTNR